MESGAESVDAYSLSEESEFSEMLSKGQPRDNLGTTWGQPLSTKTELENN